MILSKVVKAGHISDGISEWNHELSAWILENGEESEEFRPFFALGSEPSNNSFKREHDQGLVHPSVSTAAWKPIRPIDMADASSSDFSALPQLTEEIAAKEQIDFEVNAGDTNPQLDNESLDDIPEVEESLPTFEEGFRAGLAQGLEDADKLAEDLATKKVAKLSEKVDRILADLNESKATVADDLDETLARLALHLARQIVRGELRTPETMIHQLVKAALNEFSVEGSLRLYLNPDDREAFERLSLNNREGIELFTDENLSQGSVRLQQGERRTEDLIEQRLSELASRLLSDVDATFLTPLQPLSDLASERNDSTTETAAIEGIESIEAESAIDQTLASESNTNNGASFDEASSDDHPSEGFSSDGSSAEDSSDKKGLK
ncbi:flagellar assembly protein H [Marinobacterium sp. xm-d-420]|uniref:FliH/SctL family protein n=1 Tax=Marinobacterium sp. xm-d-420 TaxID=2497737 RepID=UPI0015682FCB|nr:FliH/SctL family protein [Marinobacterium sp. xm-d-420]NRP28678.1 flagellar assembly protein H [Marinobacterium sp. xm-d-420]